MDFRTIYYRTIGRLGKKYRQALYVGLLFDIMIIILTQFTFNNDLKLILIVITTILFVLFGYLSGIFQAIESKIDKMNQESERKRKIMDDAYLDEKGREKARGESRIIYGGRSKGYQQNNSNNKKEESIFFGKGEFKGLDSHTKRYRNEDFFSTKKFKK